jgi:hypothetical protein
MSLMRVLDNKKHHDLRISAVPVVTIESSDENENASDSIRVDREFDSNEIEEKDSHASNNDEANISVSQTICAQHEQSEKRDNLGCCLEYGHCVDHNIELTAEFYELAADRHHPVNYRRCMRLLGWWSVPDQSSQVSAQAPSFEEVDISGDEVFNGSLWEPGKQTGRFGWTDDLDFQCRVHSVESNR